MEIKILGTGCPNCIKLENNTKEALKISWVKANIVKISDMADIMEYDIMAAPGFVIDEKIVSFWKVLSVGEIVELLKWKEINQDESPKKCCCSCGDNC